MAFSPRNYKQIYSSVGYHLKNQRTSFTLNNSQQQPLINYTFLQSNIDKICQTQDPAFKSLNISKRTQKSLHSYINSLKYKRPLLHTLRQSQLTKQILENTQLNSIVQKFVELKQSFNQQAQLNLHAKEMDVVLPYLLASVNVMEIGMWNKVLMGCLGKYHRGATFEKEMFYASLKSYLYRFQSDYNNKKKHERQSKFRFSENKIEDLIDVQYLISSTSDPKIFNRIFNKPYQFGDAFRVFCSRTSVINKIKFSTNINMYQLQRQASQIIPSLLQKIHYLNIRNILFFYDYYIKNSTQDPKISQRLQKQLFLRVQGQKQTISDQFMLIISKSILNIWKQCKVNYRYWDQVIQPFLSHYVEEWGIRDGKDVNVNVRSIVYYMLCCGLDDTVLFNRIYQLMDLPNSKRNKTQQILYQYQKTKQQPLPVPTPKIHQILSSPQQQTIQYNPVQSFWFNILKQIVPQQDIQKSIYISVYQIDNLVKYKDRYFAFQIQGKHYRHNHDQLIDGSGVRKSGKKLVKEKILEGYGVRTIPINTEDKELRVIMRLKLVNDAKIYMQGLLDKEIQNQGQLRLVQIHK